MLTVIEDCSLVRVYELFVQNASCGFAIRLLNLERYQCSQKKEGILWTGVSQLDRKKSRNPWLLLATFRCHTLRLGINNDTVLVVFKYGVI